MKNIIVISLAFLIVIINIFLAYYLLIDGIYLIPIPLLGAILLICFSDFLLKSDIKLLYKSIILPVLLGVHDLAMKLFVFRQFDDKEDMITMIVVLLGCLALGSISFIFTVFANKKEKFSQKTIALVTFIILIVSYFILFQNV